jgi:DNA helicase-2/ATP-dependent DNA helicase PcrA
MFESGAVLDGLDEEQRQAVMWPNGPLLVLAGAGTGKTRTLTARAGWLRDQGMEPSRILLLTFTRRAADEMLSRLSPPTAPNGTADGAGPGGRIRGGTFHAIAHRIIRQFAEAFSLPPQFSVIDPGDVTDLFDVLRGNHGLVSTERRAPRAAVCADIYTRCLNTQQPVTDVVKAGFPWCTDFTSELSEMFRAYVAHKRSHGLVDFDDLLLLWRAALADSSAGPVLRGMFDAVLVDEYQDVNAVQADIVRLLRPDGSGLTCVGDDAQAIYAFRGADPEHLRRLHADFPGLATVRLTRNYRSKQAVLRLGNIVRPQSPGLELELNASRTSGAQPSLVRCYDEATQATQICARVLEAREAGLDLRDQAVLVRSAHHSDVLEIELTARGIPFVKYGGLRFTEAAHVRDYLAALRVITNPADDIAWFRVLRLHDGIGPAHARRISAALRLTEAAPADGTAPDQTAPDQTPPDQTPPDQTPLGQTPLGQTPLSRGNEAVAAAPARAREELAATLYGLAEAALLAGTAEQAAAVLAALDRPLKARYPDAAARIADLQRLTDAAASRPSLHEALVELSLDPPVSTSDLAGPPRLDDDYLVISTIHSAKGLEWPVVHLPHLVDGAVPSDMALSSKMGLEEERRLFYVAVTRARDELYLYVPLRLHHRRAGRDDRHSFGQITRFLDAAAIAACITVEAGPNPRFVVRAGPLTVQVDASLDVLWSG